MGYLIVNFAKRIIALGKSFLNTFSKFMGQLRKLLLTPTTTVTATAITTVTLATKTNTATAHLILTSTV